MLIFCFQRIVLCAQGFKNGANILNYVYLLRLIRPQGFRIHWLSCSRLLTALLRNRHIQGQPWGEIISCLLDHFLPSGHIIKILCLQSRHPRPPLPPSPLSGWSLSVGPRHRFIVFDWFFCRYGCINLRRLLYGARWPLYVLWGGRTQGRGWASSFRIQQEWRRCTRAGFSKDSRLAKMFVTTPFLLSPRCSILSNFILSHDGLLITRSHFIVSGIKGRSCQEMSWKKNSVKGKFQPNGNIFLFSPSEVVMNLY